MRILARMKNIEDKNLNIEEAIINTVVFFDMFEYPLTSFEVWKYLPVKCDYFEVKNRLKEICSAEKRKLQSVTAVSSGLQSRNGFYFLPGRIKLIATRMNRYNITDKKFKRAVFISKIFKLIPWIQMIAVGNLIGEHNLRDKSDIDFFIITQKNRIWITRFFSVLIVKFLGIRPKINDTKDKICLSFFVSEEGLDLEKLRMNKDIYFTYWLAGLTPVFDTDCYYDKLIKTNNWLKHEVPNWFKVKPAERRCAGKPLSEFYSDFIDIFFGGLEKILKKYQLKILPGDIIEIMNKDSRVVVNDKILKFHVNDRRNEFQARYFKKTS